MSAFDRLPPEYRALCVEFAGRDPPRILAYRKVKISPQNRSVRFAVDLSLARAKTFTHRDTRQQRRSGRR